jgi:hypothetical protein
MKKLGPNAHPFTFTFPPNAPCSVTLQPGDDETAKPLGVEYSIKTYVADNPEDRSHKRSSLSLAIKKVRLRPTGPKLALGPVARSQVRIFNLPNHSGLTEPPTEN